VRRILHWLSERVGRRSTTNAPASEPPVSIVDPRKLLFSMPTLNNSIPDALGPSAAGPDCYRMDEDDWRQFEFVSGALKAELDAELADIDTIWREQSVPLGDDMTAFHSIHVRERIPEPLNIPMRLAAFQSLFGEQASPLTIAGYDKVLRDVHAIRLPDVVVYGLIYEDRLRTLGLEPLARCNFTGAAADRLEQFMTEHDLRLVHWRSRTLFDTPQAAMKYLRGTGN